MLALFPRLAERSAQFARTMSGGEQQMVAIGRALMSAPNILLLDEPSLGLSPLLCSELFQALARIRETGVGILLVEQNARQSLNIADRGYLIETGRIVGQGSAAVRCADDPAVQRAYLGAGEVHAGLGAAVSDGGTNENDTTGESHETRQPHDRRPRRRRRRRPHLRPRSIRSPAMSRRARRRHRSRDAIAAADAAAAAFPAWSALGPGERRAMLLKAADLLDAKRRRSSPR